MLSSPFSRVFSSCSLLFFACIVSLFSYLSSHRSPLFLSSVPPSRFFALSLRLATFCASSQGRPSLLFFILLVSCCGLVSLPAVQSLPFCFICLASLRVILYARPLDGVVLLLCLFFSFFLCVCFLALISLARCSFLILSGASYRVCFSAPVPIFSDAHLFLSSFPPFYSSRVLSVRRYRALLCCCIVSWFRFSSVRACLCSFPCSRAFFVPSALFPPGLFSRFLAPAVAVCCWFFLLFFWFACVFALLLSLSSCLVRVTFSFVFLWVAA